MMPPSPPPRPACSVLLIVLACRVPNDELSLHILQGPDGEGEGRVQARQFAENMEASIGGGGFVEGDIKAGKSKL